MRSYDSSVVFKIHKGWKSKGDYKIHCTFSSSSRSSHILYALIMGHLMCFLKCLTSFQIFDADHHCHHQKNFRLVILYQLPTKYTFRYWHIQSENKIFCQISDSYSFLKMNYLSSFTFFHSFYIQKNATYFVFVLQPFNKTYLKFFRLNVVSWVNHNII